MVQKGRRRSACPLLLENEFLRIIDIRIDNFTKHPHLNKQQPIRSVNSLKKKMEKLHRK